MAATETEINDQWSKAVDLLQGALDYGDSTFLTDVDTLVQALEGDFTAQTEQTLEQIRGSVNNVLAFDAALLLWTVLRPYGRLLASPLSDPQALITRIYDYFVANNISIKSRGFTLASPAAGGSNVGGGTLYRLTVDENGYTFENGRADAKTAEVIQDAFSGAQLHEETLQLRGGYTRGELLEYELGSGQLLDIQALTHRNAATLQNAGFEVVTTATAVAVGSPQALTAAPTGWTLVSGTIGNLTASADDVVKKLSGESLPLKINAAGNFKLRQELSVNNVQLDGTAPYILGIWLRRVSSATGNFKLAFENAATGTATQSITQAIGSLTNSTWTFVPVAIGTAWWFKNFNTARLAVSMELSSLATATVDFDGLVFAKGTFFDGSWYWLIGGETPHKKADTFSWTDSDGGLGKRQRHLARAYGRYLPHRANATQVSAAGGRTLTFANSGSADTITASSGSFVSDGYYAGMLVTIAGTSSNNMTTGKLATVSATVLTFGADTSLVNEGPLSATATLNATPTLLDP